MLMKIVGYAHKCGSFTDENKRTIDYDNIVLDVITDVPLEGDAVKEQGGFHCSSVKIKASQLRSIFPPEVHQISDLNNWLNKEINLEYSLLGAKPVLCGIRLAK